MEIQVLKKEKDLLEIKLDNLTIAEVLRVYLHETGANFAAWQREHPTKPVKLRVEPAKDKSVEKQLKEAIAEIKKELTQIEKLLK
ncbi:hypothetical protein D6817_05330 [Candidatus Pacearchaeota archaeon]|nr:MAG: hypothetical protein D6817_05330 [Candidatus Pacearchaeota archaeon]